MPLEETLPSETPTLPTKDEIAGGVLAAGRKAIGLSRSERYQLRCAIEELKQQGHSLDALLRICEMGREFYFYQVEPIREAPQEPQKKSPTVDHDEHQRKPSLSYEEKLAVIDRVEALRYTCNLYIDDACRRVGIPLRKYYQLSMQRSAILRAIQQGLGKTREKTPRKRRGRIPDSTTHEYREAYVDATRRRLQEGANLRGLLAQDAVPSRLYFKWANEAHPVTSAVTAQPGEPAGQILEIWKRYKLNTQDTEARNALVEHYLPLVRTIAEKLSMALPRFIDVQDLIQAGVFGLLDALEGFDPARRKRFRPYATTRIWGSMMDYLRDEDWAPRAVRKGDKDAKKAAFARRNGETFSEVPQAKDGFEVSEEGPVPVEIPKFLSMSKDAHPGRNGDGEEMALGEIIPDEKGTDPSSREQRYDILRLLLRGCNRTERIILLLYYCEELTMKEVGESLDLSESRVSQMHSAIVDRQRRHLWKKRHNV